eukprot:155122_1
MSVCDLLFITHVPISTFNINLCMHINGLNTKSFYIYCTSTVYIKRQSNAMRIKASKQKQKVKDYIDFCILKKKSKTKRHKHYFKKILTTCNSTHYINEVLKR